MSATSYAHGYYTAASTQTVTTVDTTYETSLQKVPRSGKSFTDPRDGQEYAYVSIGNLDWFSQNLAFGPQRFLSENTAKPYKNSPSAVSLFGVYYTWEEAHDNPCPEGWRVPDDWAGLGSKASADALLNDERMWPYSPDNAHTNDFGWNALPLGITDEAAKVWSGEKKYGYWWSATEKNMDQGYYRYIYYDRDDFPVGFASKTGVRIAIRCVRTRPLS